MSIPKYRKFKISLNPESSKGQPIKEKDASGNWVTKPGKTQGLRTGDIVRRQYFNGKDLIYSLMCVLDYGIEEVHVEEAVTDADGNYVLLSEDPIEYKTQTVTKQQPWFVGHLLDGDAPMPGEVLDFVRITNLFDQSRSGALYLTASDDENPFMDVIDGIGRNCSLTWPEGINNTQFADPQSQYIVTANQCEVEYIHEDRDRSRIVRIKKKIGGSASIKQTFSQYIQNPNQVLISFWAKATEARKIKVTLSYEDESRTDGGVDVNVGPDWQYFLFPITVDYSGRHRRSVNFNLSDIQTEEEIQIADFNAILLSSVANFAESSQIRVGKLTGISDPVFGKLDSYGGYFQKLFATTSAHISGTLTAGDENGFSATFYAGKIHKNAFINSIKPTADILPIFDEDLAADYEVTNPTGMGYVYEVLRSISIDAQTKAWTQDKVDKFYTFSFWTYCKCGCELTVLQNGKVVGNISVPHSEILGWHRQKVSFKLLDVGDENTLTLSIIATYKSQIDDSAEKRVFLFSAPQLEAGKNVTQYQPTDETVSPTCEDYGAWFNRGGIGGTIQNPLLKLNADGEGAIEARSKGFRINQNGSGYLANKGIQWDEHGNVVFGDKVHLNWGNFGDDTKHEMENKSVRLTGGDTFAVMGSTDAGVLYSPDFVKLTIEETGMNQVANGRKWYYMSETGQKEITSGFNDTKTSLTIYPTDSYWDDRASSLTIKVVDTYLDKEYTDTVTIRKYLMDGYTVEVTSSKGGTFKNGDVNTILTAQVYYQGEPMTDDFVDQHFTYLWHKYQLPDLENEVPNWWIKEDVSPIGKVQTYILDHTSKELTVAGQITGAEAYVCEILTKNGNCFPYEFPIIF